MNTLLLVPAAKTRDCLGYIYWGSTTLFSGIMNLHLLEITKINQSFSRWDRIRLIRGSFMAQIVSGHWEVRIGQHNPGHGLLLLQRGRAQGPRASQMDFNVNV